MSINLTLELGNNPGPINLSIKMDGGIPVINLNGITYTPEEIKPAEKIPEEPSVDTAVTNEDNQV